MREHPFGRALTVELLEPRLVLSQLLAQGEAPNYEDPVSHVGAEYQKVLVAGLPFPFVPPSLADSPAQRVDPNVASSLFAGVGSIFATSTVLPPGFGALCTGTLISKNLGRGVAHVLSAGHCFDHDDDGDTSEVLEVLFILNSQGPFSHIIPSAKMEPSIPKVFLHRDFTGFASPSVNDDIAIVELDLKNLLAGEPETLPKPYGFFPRRLRGGEELVMVGYGQSGNPLDGYTVPASFSTKHVGGNVADIFFGQDDPGRPPQVEGYIFDFDGPFADGPFGPGLLGGPSLGNQIETQVGPGDSGGNGFVLVGGKKQSTLKVAAINTFVLLAIPDLGVPDAPAFGSLAGGVLVQPYFNGITEVIRPRGKVGPDSEFQIKLGDNALGGGAEAEGGLAASSTGAPGIIESVASPVGNSQAASQPQRIVAPALLDLQLPAVTWADQIDEAWMELIREPVQRLALPKQAVSIAPYIADTLATDHQVEGSDTSSIEALDFVFEGWMLGQGLLIDKLNVSLRS